jgi:ATP-dependent RNA helicase DDX21
LAISGCNLRIVAVYGGDGMRGQTDALNRGADVVVATPGRLIDFAQRKTIKFDQLECLILDEADEMLKQGFQEDIEKIFGLVMEQTSKKPQTLLFSATIPPWVKAISEKYQEKNCTVVDLIGNTDISVPKTIKHYRYGIRHHEEVPETVKKLCLGLASRDGRVIIFCETKKDVATLYEEMKGMQC